jgi:hypothetical protein
MKCEGPAQRWPFAVLSGEKVWIVGLAKGKVQAD